MIPGTSKILSKSGPGTLLIITKMLQKIQEKLWNHLGKILCLSIWDIQNFDFFRNLYVLGTSVFRFFFFFLILFRFLLGVSCVFWIYILKIILRRWGIENDSFSINKIHKSLDMNFISCKKHEMDFTLNFVFSWNVA